MDTTYEYIIVGDTEKYGECLVYVCGKDEKKAQEILEKVLTSPTDQDRRVMESHSNLRLKKVESRLCWWNDPFLAN